MKKKPLIACLSFAIAIAAWGEAPRDQGSEEYASYLRQFRTTEFPVPATSIFSGTSPQYKYAIRKLLIEKSSFRFDLRFLVFPSFQRETLFSVYEGEDGQFIQELITPIGESIWNVSYGMKSADEIISQDYGIVVVRTPMDSVLAYELIGLWNDLLENVSYEYDEMKRQIMTEDGVQYLFMSSHPSLGGLEGESINPREDTIVARVAEIGSELTWSLRDEQEPDPNLLQRIADLRKEIHLTRRAR